MREINLENQTRKYQEIAWFGKSSTSMAWIKSTIDVVYIL